MCAPRTACRALRYDDHLQRAAVSHSARDARDERVRARRLRQPAAAVRRPEPVAGENLAWGTGRQGTAHERSSPRGSRAPSIGRTCSGRRSAASASATSPAASWATAARTSSPPTSPANRAEGNLRFPSAGLALPVRAPCPFAWAAIPGEDGSEGKPVVSLPTYKDGPLGLFQRSARPVSVTALGDANRGAHSWPSAAVSNHGEPAATTPRAAGSAVSGVRLRWPPWCGKCCWRRPAATARVSSAPSRRSSARSTSTARPSTSASRSSTTCTSCATSRPAAPSSSTRRPRCPRARRSSSRRTASRRRSTRTRCARGLNTIDATCPLVTKVHVQARRYAADGYTVLLIGHAGHEEVVGTMGEAPDSIVLVESLDDVARLDVRAGHAPRLRDPDDAVGRRDVGDHHGAAQRGTRRSTRRRRKTSVTRPRTGSGPSRRCSPRSTCCS